MVKRGQAVVVVGGSASGESVMICVLREISFASCDNHQSINRSLLSSHSEIREKGSIYRASFRVRASDSFAIAGISGLSLFCS